MNMPHVHDEEEELPVDEEDHNFEEDEEDEWEQDELLGAMAERDRSHLAFEKSLKELCVDCIVDNATFLCSSPQIRQQYATQIPAVLRRSIVSQFEHQVKFLHSVASAEELKRVTQEVGLAAEELERAASLVRLLLHESFTEFDFGIFGRKFQGFHFEDTWLLLEERCSARLTSVTDERSDVVYRMPRHELFRELEVLPHLLQMPRLQHIRLKHYLCTGRDLARLAEAFPDLRSLSISLLMMRASPNFGPIFQLLRLEHLCLGIANSSSNQAHYDRLLMLCLHKLPRLKEASVFEMGGHISHMTAHLTNLQVLQQPLALDTLHVYNGLEGCTADKLPHVTKLRLVGDVQQLFLGFENLTSLEFDDVPANTVTAILRRVQQRLERLKLISVQVDSSVVFHFCPNLRSLHIWMCRVSWHPEFPPDPKNFEQLRLVDLHNEGDPLPSELIVAMLSAPRLEDLHVADFALEPRCMGQVLERLQDKLILQRLTKCTLGVRMAYETQTMEQTLLFLKLLPCFASRLKKLVLRDYEHFITLVKQDERFEMFNLPDFKFEFATAFM